MIVNGESWNWPALMVLCAGAVAATSFLLLEPHPRHHTFKSDTWEVIEGEPTRMSRKICWFDAGCQKHCVSQGPTQAHHIDELVDQMLEIHPAVNVTQCAANWPAK